MIVVVSLAGLAAGAIVAAAGPAIALLAFLGLVAIYATVNAPGVILAALMLVPFYKGAAQPYSPVDLTVVLACLNALQIIPVLRDKRIHHRSIGGLVVWLGLAVLLLAGVLYAVSQPLAMTRVQGFWLLSFLPIVPAALRVGGDARYVRQLLWTVFAMGVATVLVGLTTLSSTERLEVLGGNTISASRGALLVPLLGLAFVAKQLGGRARFLVFILIPASVVVALASGSRGPLVILGLLAIIGIIGSLIRPNPIRWRSLVVVTLLAFVSIAGVSVVASSLPGTSLQRFALFGDFVQEALSGDVTPNTGDTSSGARVDLFDTAFHIFEQHPVLGAGPGGFEALSPRYAGAVAADTYPHNAFFQVAAELGLVGLLIFGTLVGLGLFRPLPAGAMWHALRMLYVFLLLNAMVSGEIYSDRMTLGLLVLILCVDVPAAVPRTRLIDQPHPPIDT